jgi:hypothetical protein
MDLSKGPSSGPESGAGLSGGEGGPQEQPEDDIFPWTLPQVYAYFESQMGQIQTNVEGILFQEMGMLRQHITDEKILMVQQCQKLVEDLKSAQGTSGGAIDVAHIQKEVEKKLTSGLALLEDLLERKVGLLEAKLTADLHSGIGHLSGQFSLLQGQVAQDARAREQAWAVHMGRLERETLARHVSLQDLVKRIARSMMDKMQQLILQTPPPPPPPCHYAAMGRPEVELRRSMPSCQPRFEQSLQEVQDLFARNVSISQMPTSTCAVQNAQKISSFASAVPTFTSDMAIDPPRQVHVVPSFVGAIPSFATADAHVISAISSGSQGTNSGNMPAFVSNAFHPLTFSMTSRPPPKWSGQAVDWPEYRRGWQEHLALLNA